MDRQSSHMQKRLADRERERDSLSIRRGKEKTGGPSFFVIFLPPFLSSARNTSSVYEVALSGLTGCAAKRR